jgi:hypothetical protein
MANVPPGTPAAGGVVVSPPAVPGGQDQPVITVNPDVNESDDEEVAPDDEQIGDDDVSAEESAEP